MRSAEVRDVNLDVMTIVDGDRSVRLHEVQPLVRPDAHGCRLQPLVVHVYRGGSPEHLGVEVGYRSSAPGRHVEIDVHQTQLNRTPARVIRRVTPEAIPPGAADFDEPTLSAEAELRLPQLRCNRVERVLEHIEVR